MHTKLGSPRAFFKPSILFCSKTYWGAQGRGAFCREAFDRVPVGAIITGHIGLNSTFENYVFISCDAINKMSEDTNVSYFIRHCRLYYI